MFEENDHLGGRLSQTFTLDDGTVVDMDGSEIHPSASYLNDLVDELGKTYGLSKVSAFRGTTGIWSGPTKGWSATTKTGSQSLWARLKFFWSYGLSGFRYERWLLDRVESSKAGYKAMNHEIPESWEYLSVLMEELDLAGLLPHSVYEAFSRHPVNGDHHFLDKVVSSVLRSCSNRGLDDALADSIWCLADSITDTWRVGEGTMALLQAMVTDAHIDVVLNAPVRRIHKVFEDNRIAYRLSRDPNLSIEADDINRHNKNGIYEWDFFDTVVIAAPLPPTNKPSRNETTLRLTYAPSIMYDPLTEGNVDMNPWKYDIANLPDIDWVSEASTLARGEIDVQELFPGSSFSDDDQLPDRILTSAHTSLDLNSPFRTILSLERIPTKSQSGSVFCLANSLDASSDRSRVSPCPKSFQTRLPNPS